MSEHQFKYKFLNKREKQWIDLADEELAIELMSKPSSCFQYQKLCDILDDLMFDGEEVGKWIMNEDRIAFRLTAEKVMGKGAHKMRAQWRKQAFDKWKQSKESKTSTGQA